MRITVTPADVKRSKIIKPGWYRFKITGVKDEAAKDKQSINTIVDVEGLEGDSLGVPVRHWFSEKAPSFAIPFIKAMGGEVSEQAGASMDVDERLVGRTVRANVETRVPEGGGRPQNSIVDWAPDTQAAKATAAPDVNLDMA